MGNLQYLLINALDIFFDVIEMLIFVTILMSWIPVGRNNPITNLLDTLVSPILSPCRRMIENSPLGRGMMLDFSPIIALFILTMIKGMLQGAVLLIF